MLREGRSGIVAERGVPGLASHIETRAAGAATVSGVECHIKAIQPACASAVSGAIQNKREPGAGMGRPGLAATRLDSGVAAWRRMNGIPFLVIQLTT